MKSKAHSKFVTIAKQRGFGLEDGYDYSDTKLKHPVTCPACLNKWDISYHNMKAGRGCPECKKVSLATKHKGNSGKPITDETFLERLKAVRDDVELLGDYTKSSEKTLFKCKVCSHEWFVRPAHIMQNSRCPGCHKKHYDNDMVDLKLVGAFENIKRVSDIENAGDVVEFHCSKCDKTFLTNPSNLFNSKSSVKCPSCRRKTPSGGFDKTKPGTLYIACVLVNDLILYKVGITNREAKARVSESEFKRFHIFKTFNADGTAILRLENTIKRLMEPYRAFKRGDKVDCASGKTEIYTENPTLVIPKAELIKAFRETP